MRQYLSQLPTEQAVSILRVAGFEEFLDQLTDLKPKEREQRIRENAEALDAIETAPCVMKFNTAKLVWDNKNHGREWWIELDRPVSNVGGTYNTILQVNTSGIEERFKAHEKRRADLILLAEPGYGKQLDDDYNLIIEDEKELLRTHPEETFPVIVKAVEYSEKDTKIKLYIEQGTFGRLNAIGNELSAYNIIFHKAQ